MNLIETGIIKRMDIVSEHVENDPCVIQAEKAFSTFCEKLKEIDDNLINELEEIVSKYIGASEDAAYKFGISDGFNISEEVSGLTKIKGVVANG